MTRPKPLFIMGNKRSGSTLMTDLLNSYAEADAGARAARLQARPGTPSAVRILRRNGKAEKEND